MKSQPCAQSGHDVSRGASLMCLTSHNNTIVRLDRRHLMEGPGCSHNSS